MVQLKQLTPSKRAWDRRYDKNSGEEEDRAAEKTRTKKRKTKKGTAL
jgi:hypothetical protein